MAAVICNTTPLQYLHQTGSLELLKHLYQQLVVPQAVVSELRQGVLIKAKHTGLIPAVRPRLDQLDHAGFYLRPEVRARVLELVGESG